MTRPHVISTPDPPPVPKPYGPWLGLSAAFTEHAPVFTGREDVTVTCVPGAGRGAPGCFTRSLAAIELDGTHLGQDPATCDPARLSDWERYPALCGLFVHESAHAAHSRWTPPHNADTAHAQAAILLEESRIEAVHLHARPADRRWLRAATRQLILTGFTPAPGSDPDEGAAAPEDMRAPMTPWNAAHAAGLLLARVDADVLDVAETTTVTKAVTDVLGPTRLSALAALWHLAHASSDTDAETMLELGRRWCAIVGADPDQPPPQSEPDEEDNSSSEPSSLSVAITATLAAIVHTDTPPPPPPARCRPDAADAEAEERSREAADRIFPRTGPHTHTRRGGRTTAITRTRLPSPAERAAARRLARALREAGHRERVPTVTTSPTPPGRLRMRAALAADAQRAAGAIPTAEPFTQTRYRHVPTPPLRVGIACDVSGSMHALAKPVASAAWILARATSYIPDAQSATVIFGEAVRAITHPGRPPTRVQEFTARDGTEEFIEAVDALDGALDLTGPAAARLLVIVSDGHFLYPQIEGGTKRIARLTKAGCAVLWLALDEDTNPILGSSSLTLTNPAEAATAIGHAAADALRHA